MKLKKMYEVRYFYFKPEESCNILPYRVMAESIEEAKLKVDKYLKDNKLEDYCEVNGINETYSGETILD